jgi:uncharacterized tellurite resistance protein B-like protein
MYTGKPHLRKVCPAGNPPPQAGEAAVCANSSRDAALPGAGPERRRWSFAAATIRLSAEAPQEGDMPSQWSYAHDLVNIYLGIAHLADSELHEEERRTFLKKFREWMPHVKAEQFEQIWQEVRSLYDSLVSHENRYAVYLQSVLNVAQLLGDNRDQLKAIVSDLVEIAGADGTLRDAESTMIKAAAIAYGLEVELGMDEGAGRVRVSFKDDTGR